MAAITGLACAHVPLLEEAYPVAPSSGPLIVRNGEPSNQPVTPRDMMGTIFHSLFDLGKLRLARGLPRELAREMETMKPIAGLL